jgi:hypothetical protein
MLFSDDLIPTGDARVYVLDNASDLIAVEFPVEIRVPYRIMAEIDERLEEFLKREVLPLLREAGYDFKDSDINKSIRTYICLEVAIQ